MHYIDTLKQELSGTKANEQTSEKAKSVINNHISYNANRFAVSVNEDQERLNIACNALFILHVMIGMLSSHLMQSEIIIYGLVRKCVKLSPFS